MIDWLTLRTPLRGFSDALRLRFDAYIGTIFCISPYGEVKWEKHQIDIDTMRSDTLGLMWTLTRDSDDEYLTIGGSPARLMTGQNVFGSHDICECSLFMIKFASKVLDMILPTAFLSWSVRRMDITRNYLFSSDREVSEWLRLLRVTESGRHKPSNPDGESVYWNKGSSLRKGKAYHKGKHLAYLMKKGHVQVMTDNEFLLSQRLGRLELTLGSRWFRRFYDTGGIWTSIDFNRQNVEFESYFHRMWSDDGLEVCDMGQILDKLYEVSPTRGQAESAHRTWAVIQSVGFELAKSSMRRSTWFSHLKLLRDAGFSDMDFCNATITPFRRIKLSAIPCVSSWEQLKRYA